MKTLLTMVFLIAALNVFAQDDAQKLQKFNETKTIYQQAEAPRLEDLNLGRVWSCEVAFRPQNDSRMNADDIGYGFIFEKSGRKVKDLNFKNNGFKKYKFKNGELVSKKRLFIGASLTNTVRVINNHLVTEIKISGLVGQALMKNGKAEVLAYVYCD